MKKLTALLLTLCISTELLAFSPSQYWVLADYLGWTLKDNPLPTPFVTSASFSDPLPGALGQPGSKVLLGQSKVDMGWQNGAQITAGAWLNQQRGLGVEGRYFFLPRSSKQMSIGTSGEPGSPNVAVPVFDISGVWGLNGIPGETVFILPGPLFGGPGFQGIFDLNISSQFHGAEVNGLALIGGRNYFRLEALGGLRWLQLKESLSFEGQTHTVPNAPFPSGFYNFLDQFSTDNQFFGAQIGLRVKYAMKSWSLESTVKGGLGAMNQRVSIDGFSQTTHGNLFFLTSGTAQQLLPGGVFAQPSNIGTYHKHVLAALFEGNIRGSYSITNWLEVSLGYNFLWINKLSRPGDQIDRNINSTTTALANASRDTVGIGPGPIPFGSPGAAPLPSGPQEPTFAFKSTDFWAQGLTVGLTLKF